MDRPYRDDEQEQVLTVMRLLKDVKDEVLAGYLEAAESILIDASEAISILRDMVETYDEDEAGGRTE